MTTSTENPESTSAAASLLWADGSVVAGVIGEVTLREWPVEVGSGSEDDYTVSDAEDGIVAVTTIWRPGAREVEISVLGTDEGAVQAAWDFEAEEAAKRTVV